jgi:hypothetical protein
MFQDLISRNAVSRVNTALPVAWSNGAPQDRARAAPFPADHSAEAEHRPNLLCLPINALSRRNKLQWFVLWQLLPFTKESISA